MIRTLPAGYIFQAKLILMLGEGLEKVFRGKFVAGLRRAFGSGKLSFHGELKALADPRLFRAFVRSLHRTDWVVYAKKPFHGPEHVLQYLAC